MRLRRLAVGAGLLVAASGLVATVGAPAPAGATSKAVQATCTRIEAVLSDGPDPGADPVGYAEAQILPLRSIHTSDPTLRRAIAALATAYQRFFDDNGAGTTLKRATTRAGKAVDAICPGAV
jgi:hypothetical protein